MRMSTSMFEILDWVDGPPGAPSAGRTGARRCESGAAGSRPARSSERESRPTLQVEAGTGSAGECRLQPLPHCRLQLLPPCLQSSRMQRHFASLRFLQFCERHFELVDFCIAVGVMFSSSFLLFFL